jgi:ribonuclease H2 subunit C
MPFHIAYNGPAPVTSYFLVEQDVEPDDIGKEEEDNDAAVPQINQPAPPAQFSATFRGRVMKGQQVNIPAGYTGLVVCSEGERVETTKIQQTLVAKQRVSTRTKGKQTRSAQSTEDEPMEDVQMSISEETDVLQPEKSLSVQALFDSFILWNPDTRVDGGKDQYLRSLDEWIRLSEAVHSA